MKAAAQIIIYLMLFGPIAQAADDFSDAEYQRLVNGGFLGRSSFYPDGNWGQIELLIMSVDRGDTNVLNKLLDAAPSLVNVSDGYSSCSPIHWAAFKGDTNILAILLKRGAKINKEGTNWRITALHVARDARTGEFLIKHGANIKATNGLGQTPLMSAAKRGDIELASRLIAHGAKLDTRDQNDRTAIELAAAREETNMVKFLLNKGAKPVRPGKGEFAYEIAVGSFFIAPSNFPFAAIENGPPRKSAAVSTNR